VAQQYTETLKDMVGRLRSIRQNLPASVAIGFINDRIRICIDQFPQWSGLFKETIIGVPAPYRAGAIAFVQGSNVVTSDGNTNWPVNDSVNTSLPGGVAQPGVQSVMPASMAGITVDSMLYVDAGGVPEVVSVMDVKPTSFMARFTQPHNQACTVTASSFAGYQLRISWWNPIWTITAVVDPNTLLLDMPWQNLGTLTQGFWDSVPTEWDATLGIFDSPATPQYIAYSIQKRYFTIAPDVRELITVVDPTQGLRLQINISNEHINMSDPQRSAIGTPACFADRGPNLNGNMQWELWPVPNSARQMRAFYWSQWPRLSDPGDRLPYFINPTVIFYGAAADSYQIKMGKDDDGYDPQAAEAFEKKFALSLHQAIVADSAKAQTASTWAYGNTGFGGADWRQSHAPDDIWSDF
jgi:hypothetical protein